MQEVGHNSTENFIAVVCTVTVSTGTDELANIPHGDMLLDSGLANVPKLNKGNKYLEKA